MPNINKLYVAYKAGYLGDNILDTYFSFIANVILKKHILVVEDSSIAAAFKQRNDIELPLPFLRQVLGIGVKNGCFIEDHGKYSVVVEELEKYRFSDTNFNSMWSRLVSGFTSFCQEKEIEISTSRIGDFILAILDETDDKILAGEKVEDENGMTPVEFAWFSFVKEQGEKQTDVFAFLCALSASNITRQALFFAGETEADYSGLHVYLDSPIVFALLGMDEKPRTDSYKTLVADMISAKCNVHVLDHNFQEVDSIIARAASWATDTQYDMSKANNAARFFHDSQMSEDEITEFCEKIEAMLNELGVTVKETSYDIYQNQFQEDEKCLFDMVKSRYAEQGREIIEEREASIRVDVRSIIMIYRERKGQKATRIQNAGHLMLTSNNTIANVSRNYESNKSINASHIPACVSADLFGAILWLNSPMRQMEYQKKKMLADCYAFLQPDKALLDKYLQSLDDARNADEIDEKKYLFLRTHKVVRDSLMNVTKGDYARFNSKTYLEVYEDIQEQSLKQYREEAAAHEKTREEKKEFEMKAAEDSSRKDHEIEILNAHVKKLEQERNQKREEEFNKKVKRWSWITTILFCGLPYLILATVIDIVKAKFSDISWFSAIGIAGTIVAIAIVGSIFALGKKLCFKKVRSFLEKRRAKQTDQC